MVRRTKRLLALVAMLTAGIAVACAQGIALHTDITAWALQTVNVGADFVLSESSSVDVSLYQTVGNAWLKNVRVSAAKVGYRYWLSHQPLESLYVGVTATPAVYKAQIDASERDGECIVAGIGLGYCWPLSRRLNLQVSAGVGVTYLSEAVTRDAARWQRNKLTFTPADAEIRLSYIIK